jgi:hypothetical protein
MGTNTLIPAGFELDQPQSGLPDGFEIDAPKSQSWGDVAGSAAANFLPSVGHMIGGIADTVVHPIDTATNLGKAVVGAGENLVEKAVGAVNPELIDFNKQVNSPSSSQQMAGQIGDFYKQRYGSMEGFKQALSKDPAGILADAATVLTGGGAALSKLGKVGAIPAELGLADLGTLASKAGNAINPIAIAGKLASGTAKIAGKGLSSGLGVTTGAGAEAIKQAYSAGKKGGQAADDFKGNLRGNTPMQEVLETAKQDLSNMNAAKTAEYRANMRAVAADKSVLDFNNIDKSIVDGTQKVMFGSQVKNIPAAEALTKIADEIGNWKNLDPAQYHTPEGLDALKQVVGGIVESIPFEQKTARMVANNVYHSIKNEIAKQAPVYSKTMKDYADATDQIKEIERSLSLGQKSAADTSMRKLQSLMRNNVSTNYGQRVNLASELEQKGGNAIMPALAGQALNDLAPRGLARIGGGLAIGGSVVNPATLAALPLASPRLVGEAAYYSGKVAKGKNALAEFMAKRNINPSGTGLAAYQLNQPKR